MSIMHDAGATDEERASAYVAALNEERVRAQAKIAHRRALAEQVPERQRPAIKAMVAQIEVEIAGIDVELARVGG